MNPLHFEDLHVGDCWESRARTITEADVVNFACLTGDFDPLHVDHEFAKSTPFGKPIAHGLLGLAWVAGLGSNCPAVNTVAFLSIEKWDFLRPAHIGDTVRAVNEVVELAPKGRRYGQVTWRRKLVNQQGEVIQSGLLHTLVARQEPAPKRRLDEAHGGAGLADPATADAPTANASTPRSAAT